MPFTLCPILVGRDAEVDQLATELAAAQGGDGGVVFLAGEAGVGKSRLAQEIIELATTRGCAVFSGRAAESAVPVPFRPVSEALLRAARGGLTPDGPRVADYRPALGMLVPEWSQPSASGAEFSPVIVAEGLIRLLAEAGHGSLLVLDDVQWSDPDTLEILEYLCHNLSGSRVLCLATVRDSEPSAGLDAVRSLIGRRAAELITVPRLADDAVRRMGAECLGTADLPDWAAALLAESDGLPFAVEELLATAAGAGETSGTGADWPADATSGNRVPASIRSSVARRLAELGPAASDTLAWAAILGSQFDPAVLPAISGASEGAVIAALTAARQAMLIVAAEDGSQIMRFRQSLTRRTILSRLFPPDRVARSARAADYIEARYPDLPGNCCELAAELHAAAHHHGRSASLLLEAGRRAVQHGALGTAATSLNRARELALMTQPPEQELLTAIDEARYETFTLTGDHEQIAQAAERLIAGLAQPEASPRVRARILISTARARYEGDLAATRTQLEAGRQIACELGDAALISKADVALAWCAADAGDMLRARELGQRSLAAAESHGLTGWAAPIGAQALEVIGTAEKVRDIAAAEAAFERMYQIADANNCATGRINALHQLGTIEMLQDGTGKRLTEASELAHASGAISAAARIDLRLALLQSLGTDLDGARETARRCEAESARIHCDQTHALSVTVQAFVTAIRGDRAEAERTAKDAQQLLPGNPDVLFTTMGLVLVTAALFNDDLAGALRHTGASLEFADQASLHAPRLAWGLHPLLHALSGQDGDVALERARGASAAATWSRGFFSYAEAVLAGRAGRTEEAAALARDGEEQLAAFAPHWNHLVQRYVAEQALKDQWGEPVRWLRDAERVFGDAGYKRLAAGCRRSLRQAGERVPRPRRGGSAIPEQLRELGITSREMEVYRLIARGLPNSHIARDLGISCKTVETHIASLVVKTGRGGRRGLVAHAASQLREA